jgi:hypothetical protein
MATLVDVRRAAATGREASFLHPVWWLGVPLGLAAAIFGSGLLFPYFHWNWMMGELGIMEQAQLLSLVLALAVAVRLVVMPEVEGRPWLRAWLVLAVVGCLYTIGEEASYGQHFVGWSTPEGWRALNRQEETNLHNIDNWFNLKPRFLLEVAAIFAGVIAPIVMRFRPSLQRSRAGLILPGIVCLPSALLAELSKFTERFVERLGFESAEPVIGFRGNEVQESFFYLFVLFYLIDLGRKIRAQAR